MDPIFIPAALSLGHNILNRLAAAPTGAAKSGASFEAEMKKAETAHPVLHLHPIPRTALERILDLTEVQRALKSGNIASADLRLSTEGRLYAIGDHGRPREISLSPETDARIRAIHQTGDTPASPGALSFA